MTGRRARRRTRRHEDPLDVFLWYGAAPSDGRRPETVPPEPPPASDATDLWRLLTDEEFERVDRIFSTAAARRPPVARGHASSPHEVHTRRRRSS